MELSITEVIDRICLLVPNTKVACKARANFKEITLRDFFFAVITCETNMKAADTLGIGYQTVNRTLKKLFPKVLLNGGGETWDKYILYQVGVKRCNTCKSYKTIDSFDNENCNKQLLSKMCKGCKKTKNTLYYTNNINYWEQYLIDNRSDYVYRNALRRADIAQRTPKWANLDIIKNIYDNAEGMHVDHIIPLHGELVSGLHVETNMQYLTPEENLAKSNKFVIE